MGSLVTTLVLPLPAAGQADAEEPERYWEASTSTARARRIARTLVFAGAVTLLFLLWITPEPLRMHETALMPVPVYVHGQLALVTPGYVFTGKLASYNDELFAYLMFDYLRHRPQLGKTRLLLTFDPNENARPYALMLRGQTDLLGAISDMTATQMPGGTAAGEWGLVPASRAAGFEQQTRLLVGAYNLPVRRKMEDLPEQALASYLRRFILFKSRTDPRIRLKLEPVPKPLTAGDAQRLAGDIITVAQFFSLPLEFFLGIGAMENNYMDVRGDLTHSIWKKRAAPDDVVLERRRGRVRILNDSAGVWQVTRETLRFAHSLVLRDTRDYSLLPEHLRPAPELKINEVSPQVLTTYAGVLLRDLLDRFDGDVTLAVSAYNGGPGRPNLRYGEGVHRAAAHARRVLEQSAALNGESVVRMPWLRSP